MKKQTASFLDAADIPVDSVFAANKIGYRDSTRGGQFLTLDLSDSTGTINAVLWTVPEPVKRDLRNGSVVRVKGRTSTYKNNVQVIIEHLQILAEGEYDQADFLPLSKRPRKEMEQELRQYIGQIGHPGLGKFISGWLLDPEFLEKYLNATAAKRIHHACVGGLAEHGLETLKIGLKMTEFYPEIDKDFVIAGCLIHDVGKMIDYICSTVIDMTDEGKLLGHIPNSLSMLTEQAMKAGVSGEKWISHLAHIVLSHHGSREMGSPVEPATMEAMVVHVADLASGRLGQMSQILSGSGMDSENWTEKDFNLGRPLYKGFRK